MKTSHYCEKSICLPVASEAEYDIQVEQPAEFRAYLMTVITQPPELFPGEIGGGFRFHGWVKSKKLGARMRRIVISETGVAYQLRPDCVMPYLIGRTDEVEKGLRLCQQGVSFETIVAVCGRNAPFWYRAYVSLGRVSPVGTTVKDPQRLPHHLVADEKHTWLLGEPVFVPTLAAQGVVLGVSMTEAADTEALVSGYGDFKAEARELDPAYTPHTINTDGWEATQAALTRLFPATTLILCFLHLVLSIRDRVRTWPDGRKVINRLWETYREPTREQFCKHLQPLVAWVTTLHLPEAVRGKIVELDANTDRYARAYDFPGAYRTSNSVDRLMTHQDRLLFLHQYFHGTSDSARLSVRAMALLWNFHPYGRRTRDEFPDKVSPFMTLNGFQYHPNWLHNLLIAASMGGKPPKHKIR
ncbi:MAG: hypothetical protein K1Y36_01215 [Blastocatellia bacterium]|nr:hypothetical protein [Blastocatellia bacterium]